MDTAAGELSLAIRAALASSNFVVRYLPFGALRAMLVWPLLVPCIASLRGAGKAGTRRDIVNWWGVSAVPFVAILVTGGVCYVRSPDANVPAALLAALAWTGMVAFLFSMAAAYSVQQERYRVHESGWSPRKLLAGLIVLNCVRLYSLPLLALMAFRSGKPQYERAVEQGDEADER